MTHTDILWALTWLLRLGLPAVFIYLVWREWQELRESDTWARWRWRCAFSQASRTQRKERG